MPFAMSHISEAEHDEFVILDDAGFKPDLITITKGTTITWLILGNESHWPASMRTRRVERRSGFDRCRGR